MEISLSLVGDFGHVPPWGQGYLIDSLTVTDSLRRDFESISINHEIQLEKENN